MLRILADDLTGALDSAAAFDGEVPVHFAPHETDAPVCAVATATRDIAAAALPATLAAALDWLAAGGVAFKKIDSLLRGNTLAELRLAAQGGRYQRLVVAPAFPRQGRLTLDGRLALYAPGGDAPLPQGPRIADALADVGVPVLLPDVRSDADLLALAAGMRDPQAPRTLWCGSAGLAQALAQVLGRSARRPSSPAGAGQRPLLLVSASRHPATRRQWERLLAEVPDALRSGAGDALGMAAALGELAARRSTRPGGIALLDLAPAAPLPPADAAALLAAQARQIALQAPRPGVLVVVGGDTLRALCCATAARGLRASAASGDGWGQARWLGGAWDGVPCHTRSGAFGGDEDLARMLRQLATRPRPTPPARAGLSP